MNIRPEGEYRLSSQEAAHVSGTGFGTVWAEDGEKLLRCDGNRQWSGRSGFHRDSLGSGANTPYRKHALDSVELIVLTECGNLHGREVL